MRHRKGKPMKSWMAGAALLGCVVLCGSALRAEEKASEKLGWRLAIQCWTFNRFTFYETVDKAKTLGIKYLEMYPGQKLKADSNLKTDPGLPDDAIAEIKKKCEEAGVKVVNFGVVNFRVGGEDKRTFEFAKKMGIETLVTETAEKDLPSVDKLCQEYNINIALHNHPKPSPYWNPETVVKGCEGLSKRVGSCSDTGHWMRSGVVPLDGLKKLEGRIVSLHFKDLNRMGRGDDVPWGTGKGDAKAMLAELKRQNLKAVFSIEYESGDQAKPEMMENLAKCVAFFEQTAAELLAEKK